MAASTKKLRILCLHGFRQNSQSFKIKSGAFRSALKKYAEFDILEAPHQVEPPAEDENKELQEQRGWWFSENVSKCTHDDHGLKTSIQLVEHTFKKMGPYDGVLGFSQGASFAALLCHLMEMGELAITFKFLLLIAGFNSTSHLIMTKYGSLQTQALCVIGENDTIIPKERSEDLAKYFMHVDIMYHPGGHGIPIRAEQKRTFIKYLENCALQRSEDETDIIILCLHGYRQCGQVFRERTGAFRKSQKKYAEFFFCDAPHEVGFEQGGGDDGKSRGWWFSKEDNYYKAVEFSGIAKGFEESVEAIVNVFKEQGPFDGVLAFSQGASFLSLLCALKDAGDIGITFDFAILFAAFKSRCSPHDVLYNAEKPFKTRALLSIGEADDVIPLEMGKELIQYFEEPTVVFHPGGHFIANQPEQKKLYSDFLIKQQSLISPSTHSSECS